MSTITAVIPDECLNSRDCQSVCFDVPKETIVKAEAIPATVTIPITVFETLQIGSTITFNGVTFTYAEETDLCTNEIELGTGLTNAFDFIFSSFSNYQLQMCFDYNFSLNGVAITSRDCKTDINVQFNNLLNETTPLFSVASTPLELCEASICLGVYCWIPDNVLFTKCDITELNVPLQIDTGCDECDIESITACKDISNITGSYLNTPLPDVSCQFAPTANVNESQKKTIATFHGLQSDGNFFNNVPNDRFEVYNGLGDFTENCATAENPKPISCYYEDDSKTCLQQTNRIYIDLLSNVFHQVINEIVLYDANGNVIFSQALFQYQGIENGILEIQTGLANWYQILQLFGFTDFDSITCYDINITDITLEGAITYDTITYKVECCKCFVEIVFLSSKGTYESVSLQCATNESLLLTKEYLNACTPCSEPVRSVRKGGAVRTMTYNTICEHLSDEMLCELYNASEVYINMEGELFRVNPVNTNLNLLQGGSQFVQPFTVEIENKKSLVQC